MQLKIGDKQLEMAIRLIEKGANVREAEQKARQKKNMKKKDARYEAVYRDIEDSFQSFFRYESEIASWTEERKDSN